jgi:predicted molibdopterin-dependent oxidoreductase YjgC
MCDAGRLNYKWISAKDRLKDVLVRGQKTTWTAALNEISDKLKKAPPVPWPSSPRRARPTRNSG